MHHSLSLERPHVIQKRTFAILRQMLFYRLHMLLEFCWRRQVFDSGFGFKDGFVLYSQELKDIGSFRLKGLCLQTSLITHWIASSQFIS